MKASEELHLLFLNEPLRADLDQRMKLKVRTQSQRKYILNMTL